MSTSEILKAAFKAIEARKKAEKKERELKEQVKALLGNNSTLEADGFFAVLSPCQRASLDKELVKAMIGEDGMEQVTVITEYEKLEIRRAA